MNFLAQIELRNPVMTCDVLIGELPVGELVRTDPLLALCVCKITPHDLFWSEIRRTGEGGGFRGPGRLGDD